MKTKINWNEIESKTDFTTMNEKLLAASGNGGLNRRKTAVHLLEKVKDALLKVRSEGASFSAIAIFLKEHGLPVSEPTIREYLRKLEGNPKPRKKSTRNKKPKAKAPEQSQTTPPVAPVQNPQPPAPASFVYEPPRPRGPRIADPRTF